MGKVIFQETKDKFFFFKKTYLELNLFRNTKITSFEPIENGEEIFVIEGDLNEEMNNQTEHFDSGTWIRNPCGRSSPQSRYSVQGCILFIKLNHLKMVNPTFAKHKN